MSSLQRRVVETDHRSQESGAALICRFEGELRGAAAPVTGAESSRFMHDLEADVIGGPLSGRRLRGLNQLTLRTDGVGLFAGPGTIACAEGSISFDMRGFVVSPPELTWPRPGAVQSGRYDFPDHDYRVTGSAMVHADSPEYAYLDGTTASIEGWVNLESGEVELAAWSM